MPAQPVKDVVVVGGPNGAGKTTAVFDLLPDALAIWEFVNADEIARGLSPFDPESTAIAAGRLMLQRMGELVGAGQSFAFETTCASRGHARFLHNAKDAGYRVTLLFLWLPSSDLAVARVARRISEGGHRIPPDVIHRRYRLGLQNMRRLYLPLADVALIYDNSDNARVLIAQRTRDLPFTVLDAARWQFIEEASQ